MQRKESVRNRTKPSVLDSGKPSARAGFARGNPRESAKTWMPFNRRAFVCIAMSTASRPKALPDKRVTLMAKLDGSQKRRREPL